MKRYRSEESAHKAFMEPAKKVQMKRRKPEPEKFDLVDQVNKMFHTIQKISYE